MADIPNKINAANKNLPFHKREGVSFSLIDLIAKCIPVVQAVKILAPK